MGDLQSNTAIRVRIWPRRFPSPERGRKATCRHAKQRTDAQALIAASSEALQEPTTEIAEEERRRVYNREYMRVWRKQNQEQYRAYNRAYQRKRHVERKIARILSDEAEHTNLCGYGCGRPAVEMIERIEPRTWKTVRIAYCGHC